MAYRPRLSGVVTVKKGLITCHLCGLVVYGTSWDYHQHYLDEHYELEAERVSR